jgi:tRNA1Val (adenine37-N6)-methyltransferase
MKETLDDISIGDLKLYQAENGYRFSLDPVLLARFVELRKAKRIADLGTGSGIIALMLAKLNETAEIVGVELQPQLAERARRNVELNDLESRVQILPADLRQIRDLLPVAGFDLVVSNPPFRQLGRGRISPGDERAAARHELAGGSADFIAAAAWLLNNGGRFCMIHLAERLPEIVIEMSSRGIEPKRLRMIHPRQGDPARMFLMEGRKGSRPGLDVESPLYIYCGAGRDYTEDVLGMYRWPDQLSE